MEWPDRIIVILIGVFAVTLGWTVPGIAKLYNHSIGKLYNRIKNLIKTTNPQEKT